MELCYEGALVMPSSYAVMNEEEMTYVEGGFYLNKDKCITLATYMSMLTGLNVTAKVIGVLLVAVGAIELATFSNGVLGAYRNGSGVSMEWKGVFTNKHYY